MATLRANLPSRLRQLLATDGTMGPSVKLDSETPPKVKAFIDKVIQCPPQDIAIPLSGFRWEYGKGNFHHWRPLFLHFETYFKIYLSSRSDLALSDNYVEDDSPFPKQDVLHILRVMQIILENSHNKSSFSSIEYFKLLLASTDPDILIASLETLSALVKISPSKLHVGGKLVGCGLVNSCLLSLAQGWGSKEEGLGLYSCVVANEKTPDGGLCLFPSDISDDGDKPQYRLGSTLYFEFHDANFPGTMETSDGPQTPNLNIIHIPDIHLQKDDDLSLMRRYIEENNVALEHRFSLLTRIRYARAFRSPRVCRLYTRVCLLSFIVLVQSSDAHDELVSFFANEPEYTNELIRLVRSEETVPGVVRTLAMHALGAQLAAYSSSHERARILSGSNISFAGGNRTILLNVLQRAIFLLTSSNDPSSVAFVEALLNFYMLHVISSSSSGSIVRGSGMVPTFLPLLEDSDATHIHLVCLAVKTLQKLMDYSNTAVTLFKDLGGVELLTNRLQIEVQRVINMAGTNDIGESSRSGDDQPYAQKRLIRVILKALGSATYTPANSARSQNAHDASLPVTLALIFANMDKFGGEIYSSAVTVMSEIIHKDPTCFHSLLELGLPDAFLSSVASGILPSSKALTCVPNGIGAICLIAKGLEAVKETSALRFLVDIFTQKKYVVALNDGIIPLSNSVEELLRHVTSLRGTGVDLIIEIVNKIASTGDSLLDLPGKVDSNTAMEMDSEDKENNAPCCLVSTEDSTANGIKNDRFIQLCVFHVMILVHRIIENAETCRIFVEKSGIDALLKLLLRPSIVQSSEGMSIALHSTMVFKGFTQHHSAPLARAFCSSLRGHLKKATFSLHLASGTFLLNPSTPPNDGIFSSLFLVEFLLLLAASKEDRWVTALLTEFGNESQDVLEDIGRLQREVLWQIALLEDAKVEMENDVTGSALESRQSELSTNDIEDQRFNSFRQFLDPLLRRRMSAWSFEFFNFINPYRDLSLTSGLLRGQGINSISTMQLETSHQQSSGSGNNSETNILMEDDKQRSYHSSCCVMLKSLPFQIMHLCQELGKVMLLPSRRRDDMVSVSPSSKSVASAMATIVLDHMNFGGYSNSPGQEVSVSTKCRYLGKVVDFVDAILLDKPDSCNPVLVNCLYGRGVVQSILTTFEATSQLLFAVNRVPASPMETDDGSVKVNGKDETDWSWIYVPLASYGKLMDHLVTSSYILSPFTKNLFTQPLVNGDAPFPRDAETFVKILQSMVLKALLPVWTHPQFTECSYDFIATMVSMIRHIYSGVEMKKAAVVPGSRAIGPPPNESTITTIEEMGFSRSRAEEALRQIGANSVELAMEWLFSHPEEPQEEDELARALAMSLGNSGSETKEDVGSENSQFVEEEIIQPPPVEELLSTCIELLKTKDTLAFPVRDLLTMICSQNDGQYRSNVVSFLVEQVENCKSGCQNDNMQYALFHVLALLLHDDTEAREVALKSGMVKIASDMLSHWVSSCESQVPKWVTPAFLAVDRLLQVDQKLNADVAELLKKDDGSSNKVSITIDEDKQNKLQPSLGLSSNNISVHEKKRLIEIACGCMKILLPSETMHAVLQLCCTLTKTHSVAVSFLDNGGLSLLLSLPANSLFVGFDSISASIIRHILEDPQTLQQAMESEIRHSIITASNRHSNGRLTPRNFLLNLTSVISRDPVVFLQASQTVCQVEMVGERPYIVLLKDRDKDKVKEKDKDKGLEKGKLQTIDGKGTPGNSLSKTSDSILKGMKIHKKPPQNFMTVIELLLDSVVVYFPTIKEDHSNRDTSSTEMDIDTACFKGKGKAIASSSEQDQFSNQENSTSLAKIVFILKILTEILWMYNSSIYVLLRKDTETSNLQDPHRVPSSHSGGGGLFSHILHRFLPFSRSLKKEKKTDTDWKHKLASRANQFLVASCVRSTEARRRIFTEINIAFTDFVESSAGSRPAGSEIPALIDLLNDVVTARSPTGSHISAEASATFIDVGLVKSLTRILQVLDLDHAESPKVVTVLVKVLELVTKEHVHAVESNPDKTDNSTKSNDHSQDGQTDNNGNASQSRQATVQHQEVSASIDHMESFNATPTYGGLEAVTDDMEHDLDLDGRFVPAAEDDYMHEASEDTRGLENGLDSVGIRFEIQPHDQGNIGGEDDEDMSGEDVDDVDEEDDDGDEEHNDIDEDEAHLHLPHADTDLDEHEIDEEDEFDEVMEEEDEDEEDEEGVVLRLEEGLNGVNVFDHIEVFGRDHGFGNETLHVMPAVEVFGSRRQGRTTSIYNLLGRTGENAAPSIHPLLVDSSQMHVSSLRQPVNAPRAVLPDRNLEIASSSQLDAVFRSLRNGRHGHRFNLWADDIPQSGGSNSVPQGLEDLLVSHLRRPDPEKQADQNTVPGESQNKMEGSLVQIPSVLPPEVPDENADSRENNNCSPLAAIDNSNANITQVAETSCAESLPAEMQFEPSDAIVRDVEAVSQESSGSGATLGESLRSLDVEIGSADGHDDGGERQSQADARARRMNTSLGGSAPVRGGETPLNTVADVSANLGTAAGQIIHAQEQQVNADGDSGSIDPAFLDALPDELRAEVLSAQQGQVAQPTASSETQTNGDIDPEFLAALPPDIREEVLAQQRVQRLHQSQELEGQPVEMDTVSIIATFPSELREEVLLTSSHDILANLTPALVAEANMLRERFANRYNRPLFGMYPRSRRGESSRRGEGVGSSLDRSGGTIARKATGAKPVEAEGAPLVDTEALRSMIRLLRVVQPLYKGQLQRLLLNLCAHIETRTDLVKILMDLLMLDTRKSVNTIAHSEPSYRLYACQSHVMYSRPQSFDGLPPLVSRRVLETLTYLARNHPYVANILLKFKLPAPLSIESGKAHGKAVMITEDDNAELISHQLGSYAIALLLSLLNQPLYLRSIAHLEQLLNLLDVIIDNAHSKSSLSVESGVSAPEQVPQSLTSVVGINTEAAAISGSDIVSTSSSKLDNSLRSSISAIAESDTEEVLLNLPQKELRLLCSLLAREGLSDTAYSTAAEFLKKLVAKAPSHCHLLISELAHSVQDLCKASMSELNTIKDTEKALLSTTSSDGATILRVLQALSSLVTAISDKDKGGHHLSEKEYSAALSVVHEISAALEPLWLQLSICINTIESNSDSPSEISSRSIHKTAGVTSPLPAGTQNILPYIESFFVVCEKLHPEQPGVGQDPALLDIDEAGTSTNQQKTSGLLTKNDEKHVAFVRFSEKHRRLLNAFVRQNPVLLEKSFSLFLKVPRFIDFDNKRAHFRSKIKHQHDHHHSPLRISVRRAYILEDSYNQLRMRSTQDLKGRLTVHFQGEEGIDAGGLSREWYQLLSRVIFDKGALLFTTVGNDSTFQPNPNSVYQTEHLSYFKFVGRVVGKALFDGQLLDVHFTRSFYKHILGVKVTYHDIEAIDPDYFKNLKWMLENDITDLLDLTFSIDADEEKLILYEKTEVTDYELIPDGRNIRVTEENKHKYVDLVAEHRLTTAIRPQINAFLEGFNELISPDLISIFNDKELELLISGLPEIDLDDMRANTEYSGYSAASAVIQWFWEVAQGFSKEDKARLLQFVTGTSKVPLEGFSALQGISGGQKFQIHKAYGSASHLPSAHTCFNQLDLPEYPSKQHLEERLLLAIHEANEGFGFG